MSQHARKTAMKQSDAGKCGKEETVILPAKGHIDKDGDGICDICYEPADGVPEAVHYSIGDIQARTIGNKIYLFRCIDDDYEDAMDNSQKTAPLSQR